MVTRKVRVPFVPCYHDQILRLLRIACRTVLGFRIPTFPSQSFSVVRGGRDPGCLPEAGGETVLQAHLGAWKLRSMDSVFLGSRPT